MNDYKSMADRIDKARTVETLNKLSKSLDRLYNVGIFTASELRRLDLKICDRSNYLTRG